LGRCLGVEPIGSHSSDPQKCDCQRPDRAITVASVLEAVIADRSSLMKKFLAACLVPVCLAAVALPTHLCLSPAVAQAAPAGQWQTVKGNGFSIRMPGTPTRETQTTQVGPDSAAMVKYEFGQSRHLGYIAVVMDMPPIENPTSQMTQAYLDELANDPSTFTSIPVVAKMSLMLGGHPGRELTLSDGSGLGKMRIFVVKNRLYVLMAGGGEGQANRQNIDTFLRSFKLATP
jgi:hypothetical protein